MGHLAKNLKKLPRNHSLICNCWWAYYCPPGYVWKWSLPPQLMANLMGKMKQLTTAFWSCPIIRRQTHDSPPQYFYSTKTQFLKVFMVISFCTKNSPIFTHLTNKFTHPPTNSAISDPFVPQEDGCLLLPKPVTLHESGWTLSCWILAPIHGGARASARHLLDGGSAEERVMVALVRGKLRNIAEGGRRIFFEGCLVWFSQIDKFCFY